MAKPAFIITLDTEGDNLWESGPVITTQNTVLPRFQALCEKYSFKPVWLTNYEMATDDAYIEFAQDVIAGRPGDRHASACLEQPAAEGTDVRR